MLVPEMQLTHEGQLFADVQDHLSGLLGIDHLRLAARTARQVQATTARQVRAARQAAQVDEAILARARAAARAAEDELAEVDRSLEARADQLRRLDAVRDDLAAWARYDDATAAYQRQLEELAEAARIAGLAVATGTESGPAAEDLDPVLDAQEHIARQARELTTELAEARAEESLVRGLIDQLDAAGAVCPVCLRPVDGEVAEHAAGAHRARLAEIEARQAAAEQRHGEVAAAAERVGAIATALARLRPPEAPGVPRPATDAEAVETERANLRELVDAELGRRGALGEQLAQAERVIAEADRSQAAAAELTRHSAVEAAAGALAELATAEADARTEQCLDPLSRTLARRWAEFFVGSGTRPRLAGGGSIELGHPTAAISYASFSGGEKTLASLLTRLLFVTSATGLDCMWLDEPLEHLDPANRTRVARLLAQVVQPGGRLRQVLVTTYEEALARSMIERHAAAGIVYVSTDELL
jgi:DNA repair exonuclease SbcCD ATPase subunit